ncbi:hypothetical protein ABID99_000125 [Mucilaginibacter sp. OAE612]|uniref:hypothetical protein n=1 Tax=Mucilaginibacter sp. OAE612 TaxID=3156444 RepID=UPI00359EC208
MNTKVILGYLLICVCFLSSCQRKPTASRDVTSSPTEINADSLMRLSLVENNKYLTFDTLKFLIPEDLNIDLSHVYSGIYEIKGNSFKRHKSLIFNNHAFLTTCEDLGKGIRAYLYVFDIRSKSLIKDSTFKRKFLYSSAGIFIVDRKTNRIFSVDKPEWYDAKEENIIPASISYIRGDYFENLKNVYKVGDEIPTDTSLVSFFNESMAASSKDVLLLPNDWWKPNK